MRNLLACLFVILCNCIYSQKYYLFIGSYTGSGSKGIYVYRFNAANGNFDSVSCLEGIINPSFLTVSSNGKYVYACTETRTANAGSVSAFTFEKRSGKLRFINKQPSGGDNPVYVAEHKSGKWLVCANYTGGSVAAFQINKGGSLSPASQVIKHSGSSVDEDRQDKPHVHSVVFSPDQKYVYAPDLGLDKVVLYSFQPGSSNPLQKSAPQFATVVAGGGPRHFTFHPNRRYAYLVEEMGGAVDVFSYNRGAIYSIQRITTHGADSIGPFSSADIHVSPDGKFLYVSNRGSENNIAIFSIDSTSGKITSVGYQSTLGEVPRNFVIEPSGKYLLVANQVTGNIVVFWRNQKTGLLTATGKQIEVPEASCLQMVKI